MSTRYQVVYIKRGVPLATWTDSKEDAEKKAATLRGSGYDVDVWEHDKDSARKIRGMTYTPADLKAARTEKGLSQARAAELLEIPKRTWEQWETGDRTPPAYVLRLVIHELERLDT
jgi:DNA-binding transcriptional regulator YiaG